MLETHLPLILFLTIFYILLVMQLCKKFTKDLEVLTVLSVPIITFGIGFAMRLAKDQQVIDLGFYFTESSVVFIYVLFTAALLLGQIKYWKK